MPIIDYVKSYRGDTVEMTLYVEKNGVPFDITGCTLFFTAKANVKDADNAALVSLSTGSGITHTTPLTGIAKIIVPSGTTNVLDPKHYICDVQLKLPTGEIKTLGDIVWTIKPDTTRRTS